MRTSVLLTNTGDYVNPEQSFINSSSIDGSAGSTLFFNQISLEFFNNIITLSNGSFAPDGTSVVKTGLTGTVEVEVNTSEYSPYPVNLSPDDIIDVSESCMIQWTGITYDLDLTCSVTGANFVHVLLDRS